MAGATIGVRVKSGWATAVLVVGAARAPRAADRCVVELSDPAVPASRQPYHAVMGASPPDGEKIERYLRKVIERVSRRSVRALLKEYRTRGHDVRGVGLVVGSDIDPGRIANEHIRAHALEGRLFRTVLEAVVDSFGLPCGVVVEREAYALAARVLKRSEAELRSVVGELGRSLDGPWRADEKTASLAAWMMLRRRYVATTLRHT